MGKGFTNGGIIANRGFIFQTIIAEIQCLERNDWDAIKMEPGTTRDKVDIKLYKCKKTLSAMQVKSSKNPFERSDVKKWLEDLRSDAAGAEEICLYLVGDYYKSACEDFIAEHSNEIIKISFVNLDTICMGKLVEYIRNAGVGGKVRVDDLEFIDDALFAKLFKNSIAEKPISRAVFKERFQKALPVHIIPKCLTPIPTINHVVGLVGRDDIKKSIREMLDDNDRTALVNGLGGIGKTAVMQHICNDLKNEGKYVAWIECGRSLKEDLLLLRTALGIPESDDADKAYGKILYELQANRQLASNLYLFLDNLSRMLGDEEQEDLNRLGIHVMATSRFEHEYFENLPLDVLVEDAALDMFYGYYLEKQKDKTRRYVEATKEIIESVQRHTMLVELLAKAAKKKGGTLEAFRDDLEEQGVFDVFKSKLNTKHDKDRTIEECVMELYIISGLTPAQQHIMNLFTIFTPEKAIYYKIVEWAELDMDAIDELVDLGWLERGGLENGYQIHQIVKDSLARQLEKNSVEVQFTDYGGFLDKVIDTNNYLKGTVKYDIVRERVTITEDVERFLGGKANQFLESLISIEDEHVEELEWLKNVSRIRNNLAGVFLEQGDYSRAIDYYNKAIIICERVWGEKHLNTAAVYRNISQVYGSKGDYSQALEYCKKTLKIHESLLGTNHYVTALTYNIVAELYEEIDDIDNALEYIWKAFVICKRLEKLESRLAAMTYANIARMCYKHGEYEDALKYFDEVLNIYKSMPCKNSLDVSSIYNNKAVAYYALNKYTEALDCADKALSIRKQLLDSEHPSIAITYNTMAGVYEKQNDYPKALEYYQAALYICIKRLGEDHPTTKSIRYNLNDLLEKREN